MKSEGLLTVALITMPMTTTIITPIDFTAALYFYFIIVFV